MTTPERDPEGVEQQLLAAAGEPGADAAGPASRPVGRAFLRALAVAAGVVGLGFAAGSWATPSAVEAAPDEPFRGSMPGEGCRVDLPPGHPPIGTMQGLPPGHPPVRAVPRLPAGHPPIPAQPLPELLSQQLRIFTI